MKLSIGETIYKIVDYSTFIVGYIFSVPVILTSRYFGFPVIKPTGNEFDIWTFAHFYATLLIAFLLYTLNISILISSLAAFIIMYIYELIIDGLLIEDNGFSISDIGANTLSLLILLILYFIIHKL